MNVRSLIVATAAVLAGCASTGGIQPTATLRDDAQLGARATDVQWPADTWWTELNDAVLNELVEQALAGNSTLVSAQARLQRAQAAVSAAAAADRPQVNAGVDVSRQRYSESGLLPRPIAGSAFTTYTMQLAGSWELDLFGRNRAALASAVSAEKAAAADQQAARVLLATNVVRTYVQLARLMEQRAVLNSVLEQREQILGLVRTRVQNGLDTNVELRQAEGTVPEIRRDLAAVDEQIVLTRNALAALMGKGPEATATLEPRFGNLAQARWLTAPSALPADLLGRRADVAAARWRVDAAAHGVDEARAQFYPNINLTAFVGLSTITLSKWLDVGSEVYGGGPALRLPVLDGGRLRANLSARSADVDAAVATYNGALTDAVRDVADQLASLASIERQRQEHQRVQEAAESALDLATLRYQAGLGTYLTVLTAEGNVLVQRRLAADLAARALDTRVQLVRALGGGFDANVPAAGANGAGASATAGAHDPIHTAARAGLAAR